MPPSPRPRPNQPCLCGSGKKYRDCCARKDDRRRKLARQSRKWLGWVGGIAVLALVVYGFSRSAGVPYDDTKIAAVNFSGLDAAQKRRALRAANAARCNCGCGMALAECVATDSTCPIRTDNIARIKGMVSEAMQVQ